MSTSSQADLTANLQLLDIHTLSEDWALADSLCRTWGLLAESIGRKPSTWIDGRGDRMYAAVMWLSSWFDLSDPVCEDDIVAVNCTLLAIRKPHALSRTQYSVAGRVKAEVRLLTSFVKRDEAGSNKKFSKVRDVWQADDFNAALVDDLLAQHHLAKSATVDVQSVMEYQVNRIQDFNAAGLLYFKNFVRIAKASEWQANRGLPTRLNQQRTCYYFANADDGDRLTAHVGRVGDATATTLHDATGQRLFLSRAVTPLVDIVQR